MNHSVYLRARQLDTTLGEAGDEVSAVVHAGRGHQLGHPPGVVDLTFHELSSPSKDNASLMVASSARRKVRVRKSLDTQV